MCPALSLRPLPALCYVLFVFLCVYLGRRACSGSGGVVGNVPLYHCGHCRLYVCLFCVCLGLCAASKCVPRVPLYHCSHCQLYYYYVLFVLCVFRACAHAPVSHSHSIIVAIAEFIFIYLCCVSLDLHVQLQRPLSCYPAIAELR